MIRTAFALILTLVAGVACERRAPETVDARESAVADSLARARQDSINRATPGYVVDSILPVEEEIRRFTADLPSRPTRLANGAESRDALVRRWIAAVEQGDSLTLIHLALNRPEFALLVYPSSPYTKAPMRQPPWLVWRLLSDASVQGFRRTIERLGGKPLRVVDWTCPNEPDVQGENRIWSNCRIRRVRADGDTLSQRLFGPIIARDGIYKFVTLATEM